MWPNFLMFVLKQVYKEYIALKGWKKSMKKTAHTNDKVFCKDGEFLKTLFHGMKNKQSKVCFLSED